MSLVIDSSITLAWLFEDECSPVADETLDQVTEHGAFVPSLWKLEVANALKMAVKRGRIDVAFRDASIESLRALRVVTDPETDQRAWTSTLQLADRCGLTLYDAAYLELAQRLGLPLATLDKELSAAASLIGVQVLAG